MSQDGIRNLYEIPAYKELMDAAAAERAHPRPIPALAVPLPKERIVLYRAPVKTDTTPLVENLISPPDEEESLGKDMAK
jgi:hypothetical protein